MAKTIDFSKPLSEDDKQYVASRPWLLQDAQLRGERIIDEDEFFVDESEDDNLEEPEGEQPEGEGEDSTEEVEGEEGEPETEELPPYEEWEYAALKDEADRRGLAKNGSKEQLINRLKQDDESNPE
jgi:hypothetical protein